MTNPIADKNMMELTLKQLLENPLVKDIAPYAISSRDLSKDEFYPWTLQEIVDKMGWRTLSKGFARLYDSAARGNWFFKLYTDEECAENPSRNHANLVYIPSDDPAAAERPFIFLVPGGGFVNVWNLTEGWPMAHQFNSLGYHTFILTYQVNVDATALNAMSEMSRAMKIISQRREEFGVQPDNYITCGFSAGGYIVCLWNTEKGYPAFGLPKPRACFPVYPVTSYRLMDAEEWGPGENKDEFAFSGVGCTMEEARNSCFEIPEHVEFFPPTAIFLAAEDDLVDPEHSKKLAQGLENAGIPCYMEIGKTGGHGFADGEGMCMEGWPQRAVEWFEKL